MLIVIVCSSSDNSEIIASQIQNISDINEESGSDDITHKAECTVETEKVSTIPCDKKNLAENSASSSSSSSDSSSSDSDTDNSSGKY